MIPEEVLRKIQRFHFRTKRQASELFAGQFESAFKGRGMEFADVRAYQIGDDIRAIDWNVSARCGQPYVKLHHEERELTVMLLLDLSGSHLFGTRSRFKRDLLAEVAGMLAFLATRTNDKVGAILFSSRVERYLPPKKGASHVWRLIKEIFTFQPGQRRTDLAAALAFLNQAVKRHAIVFLISDCDDTGYDRALQLAAKKHDLTVIRISDPAEDELPQLGLATLEDPETGEIRTVDTGKARTRESWRRHRDAHHTLLAELASRCGVDLVELHTGSPVVEPLLRLFEKRKRRLAG